MCQVGIGSIYAARNLERQAIARGHAQERLLNGTDAIVSQFRMGWFSSLSEAQMITSKTALTSLAFLACFQAVAANAYQGNAKEQAACRPDVRRYCSSIKPGSDEGMFLSCLQAHRAKLSKACNEVLTSHGV